ncbi:hypothetical protein BAE44_0015614 [Dichanthelium oligosanthes]|uniref:Uncharacterized protein n=1 Tax=Dichanthelium oligosanthes TaxID=888268 RepID=A0A1E5VED0_9POAL|nr:hypothetical protein BAE44_0015614 [Dichanthelium oligosanthes]
MVWGFSRFIDRRQSSFVRLSKE